MLGLPPLPDKEFFSIGEVSVIAQIPSYVLRYWESEFRLLRPSRRVSGQRKYIKKDIEKIFMIKDLLYAKKYTIAGAKKYLLGDKRSKNSKTKEQDDSTVQLHFDVAPQHSKTDSKIIKEIKQELEEVLELLK